MPLKWRRSQQDTEVKPQKDAAVRPEKKAAAVPCNIAAPRSRNEAAPGSSNVAAPGRSDVAASGSRSSSQLPRRTILIVGVTGHGKSTFINHVLSTSGRQSQVGHGSRSTTEEMEEYDTADIRGRSYMLVDSPGFGDTSKSDDIVLMRIVDWLEKACRKGVCFSGVIFVRSIDEKRMHLSDLKALEMVRALCSDDALANVRYVTTHWDVVKPETAEKREQELREDYLKTHLNKGAKLLRHNNTVESAMAIVRELSDQPPVQLSIQKQLVNEKKHFLDTDVGALTSAAEKREHEKTWEAAKARETNVDSGWTVERALDNTQRVVGIVGGVAGILTGPGCAGYKMWSDHQLSSKKMDVDAAHDAATQRKEEMEIIAESVRDGKTQKYGLITTLAGFGVVLACKMWLKQS